MECKVNGFLNGKEVRKSDGKFSRMFDGRQLDELRVTANIKTAKDFDELIEFLTITQCCFRLHQSKDEKMKKSTEKVFGGKEDGRFNVQFSQLSLCNLLSKNGRFWLSIKKAKDCLFSRRNGYRGKIIFGYSICIRIFGYNY